jgi:Na+/H+-dicarboxylate symporter
MGVRHAGGRRFPFAARIVAAMLLGVAAGEALGRRAEPLGQLGAVVIDLIKALAGPLLLFAVLDAFLRTRVRARSAGLMVAISLCNAALALAIGLTLSNVLQPGRLVSLPLGEVGAGAGAVRGGRTIDVVKELVGYVPKNVVQPFLENSILSIVLLAVLLGAALRRIKDRQEALGEDDYRVVESFVLTVFRAIEQMLAWVVAMVPLAVFGVVARTIGREGFAKFGLLLAYVGVAALGLAIQVFVVYQGWLVLVARMPLRRFWAGARDPLAFVVGASSSLATMPVTLRALDRMGVSPQSARMAACVGTNLNNDGIVLYEAMAVLFVAQVHGITLSLPQQLLAAVSCLVASVGIAGIPDAGLISLSLVLTTVGLPVEVLPLLLTVDWLLSRCRAATNVVSDLLVAVLLDRLGGVEAKAQAVGADAELV